MAGTWALEIFPEFLASKCKDFINLDPSTDLICNLAERF